MEQNEDTELKIEAVCASLAAFLKEKNRRYGDSALAPKQIFSKENKVNSITIRLDDKISRIANSEQLRKNDITDLTGYLILLMIANNWTDFSDMLD